MDNYSNNELIKDLLKLKKKYNLINIEVDAEREEDIDVEIHHKEVKIFAYEENELRMITFNIKENDELEFICKN